MLPLEKIDEHSIDRLRSVVSSARFCLINGGSACGVVIEDSKLLIVNDEVLQVAFPNIDHSMTITHICNSGGVVVAVVESYCDSVQYTLFTYAFETNNVSDLYSMSLVHSLKVDYKPLSVRFVGIGNLFLCVAGCDCSFHLYQVTMQGVLRNNKSSEELKCIWNHSQLSCLAAGAVVVDILYQGHCELTSEGATSHRSYQMIMTLSNGYLYKLTVLSDDDSVDRDASVGELRRDRVDRAYHLFPSTPSVAIFLPNSPHVQKSLSDRLLVGLCSGELGILELRPLHHAGQKFVPLSMSELLNKYCNEAPSGTELQLPSELGAVTSLVVLDKVGDSSIGTIDVLIGFVTGVVCILRVSLEGPAHGDMSGSLIAENIDIENDTIDVAPAAMPLPTCSICYAMTLPEKIVNLSQLRNGDLNVVIATSSALHIYRYSC
jgi:hypothetical protein